MKRWRRAVSLCLMLAQSVVFTTQLRAQAAPDSVEAPTRYRKAVEAAVQEFEARNYAEARALFEQAHALYPNARTERGMGFAEFELRHYGPSVGHLEAALASSVRPLTAELRHETEELLARAKSFVAHVQVDAKPASATILIDGVTVEVPAGQALMLDVGDHMIEACARLLTGAAEAESAQRRTAKVHDRTRAAPDRIRREQRAQLVQEPMVVGRRRRGGRRRGDRDRDRADAL